MVARVTAVAALRRLAGCRWPACLSSSGAAVLSIRRTFTKSCSTMAQLYDSIFRGRALHITGGVPIDIVGGKTDVP